MNGSGKGQMAAYALAAVLLVIGGLSLVRGSERAPAQGGGVALDGAGAGAAREAGSSGSRGASGERAMYVHVAGAVKRPGIYRLWGGARVAAAVRRAGGLTSRADLTAFNLAAPVQDAQQVIVPRRGRAGAAAAVAPGSGPSGAAAGGPGPGQKVSLATATPEQLDSVDGIGPKLAAAIIAYRNQHRGFKSIEELREVDGIGEKRFAALRGAVRP